MGKFVFTETDGTRYTIDADDEDEAMSKYQKALKEGALQDQASKVEKENQDKEYQKYRDNRSKYDELYAGKQRSPVDYGLTKIFGPASQFLDKYLPGNEAMKTQISPSLTKGVPIAGRYVPQTEELSKFEEDNPVTSKVLQGTGTVGSMLGPTVGAANATARLAPNAANGVLQFLRNAGIHTGGQFGVNAPVNLADQAAKAHHEGREFSKEDAIKALKFAGVQSALPGTFTTLAGQAGRLAPIIQRDAAGLPVGATRATTYPPVGRVASTLENTSPATRQLAGAGAGMVAGHALGLPLEGAAVTGLLGGSTGEAIGQFLGHHGGNILQHPTTQDIIRILATQGQNKFGEGYP